MLQRPVGIRFSVLHYLPHAPTTWSLERRLGASVVMPVTRTIIGLESDANGPQLFELWPQNNVIVIDRPE
jgi:hypothetical protein